MTRAGEVDGLTSRREFVAKCLLCELKLFWGVCDRPVMGFLDEVQAFCWTGGCLVVLWAVVRKSVDGGHGEEEAWVRERQSGLWSGPGDRSQQRRQRGCRARGTTVLTHEWMMQ